jgi:Domain of unknown function (DUF1835)
MLHILNGSSTEQTLRQTSIAGELFSFRDALIAGPAPEGLDEDSWRRTRAQHLSEDYGVNTDECERDLLLQTEMLSSCAKHDEIVLWFEHDLFCQLNLLYLLNWFSNVEPGNTKLSLINVGTFPGKENFRGLGELNADELASLFPERRDVTSVEFKLAQAAWNAFCSVDPTSIEALLDTDTSALPFLSQALLAHLRRFPSTKNGLGKVENQSLELIDDGYERFTDFFLRFIDSQPVYGLGDAQVWRTLHKLSGAMFPLLTMHSGNPDRVNQETTFQLTNAGMAVLKGDADFLKLNEIDEWLGGVHLHASNQTWRWDEDAERLKIS